jgi:hypothetical protein
MKRLVDRHASVDDVNHPEGFAGGTACMQYEKE